MTLDELEALRLADLGGLYQEAASKEMGVSRTTFGRILESARRKVAEALVHSLELRIEGGSVDRPGKARCSSCRGRGARPAGCGCCHRLTRPAGVAHADTAPADSGKAGQE